MQWVDFIKNSQTIVTIIPVLLLILKMVVIVAGRKKAGNDYRRKILGWYTNMEIYGSGNPFKVRVLNAANMLTIFFWITLVVVVSFYFLRDQLIN